MPPGHGAWARRRRRLPSSLLSSPIIPDRAAFGERSASRGRRGFETLRL
jgi:hypothetical protein